jgi:hypothetical protein
MLLMSLACDAIALGSNQVEVEVEGKPSPISSFFMSWDQGDGQIY